MIQSDYDKIILQLQKDQIDTVLYAIIFITSIDSNVKSYSNIISNRNININHYHHYVGPIQVVLILLSLLAPHNCPILD